MDFVLHIGAHRTGSTMIERAITQTVAAHPECDVAIWPPKRLRDIEGFQAATRHMDGDAVPISKASAEVLERVASDIATEVAKERDRGVRRLIVSEENLLGGMRNNLFSGAFYPDVGQRLAAYDSLFPMSPTNVALGIREYGAVWSSAYFYLPQSGHSPPPERVARAALFDKWRGWPEVISEARDVWPDASFIVWRQEDLADHARKVCVELTGLSEDQIVLPEGKVNARTSTENRPTLFSEEESKHLRQRYSRHVRRLQGKGLVWPVGEAS